MNLPNLKAVSIFAFLTIFLLSATQAQSKKLNPGEFEWNPELSPHGPLLVVCSIDDQVLYLYRNGKLIARSTVSTGKAGHETPTGVFSILQRKVDHESSIYKGAKMPYMQRLTWTGIAMHAGKLPGYPASHGCIRLPYEFSGLLYDAMGMGATVVITKSNTQPSSSFTPASILMKTKSRSFNDLPIPKGRTVWTPEKSTTGSIGILLSYADRTMYVWRNGVQIGQTPFNYNFGGEAPPQGVFVMLESEDASPPPPPKKKKGLFRKKLKNIVPPVQQKWAALSLHGNTSVEGLKEKMDRGLMIPQKFGARLSPLLKPGTLFFATSDPSTNVTRSSEPMAIAVPLAPKK